MEKDFKDFNKTAKKGISKFSGLSSKGMKAYGKKYESKTGKSGYNVNNKEDFYMFVARNKLRRSK